MPEEIGIGMQSDDGGDQTSPLAPSTNDPASLVFRPPHEVKRTGSNVKELLLVLVFVAIVAYAYTQIPDTLPAALLHSDTGTKAGIYTGSRSPNSVKVSNDATTYQGTPDPESQAEPTQDVCDEMVEDIIGPRPVSPSRYTGNPQLDAGMLQQCINVWSLFEYRIKSECGLMKSLARKYPQDGSPQAYAVKRTVESKYDNAFRMSGEYYLKQPSFCK
jgi:hypothetical protein